MAKWTKEEIETLGDMASIGFTAEEVARILKRSPAAVSSAASARCIEFASTKNAGLRAFLKRGGYIMREDIGGVIGVLWSSAHRGERPERYNTTFCEKLKDMGFLTRVNTPYGEVYCRA